MSPKNKSSVLLVLTSLALEKTSIFNFESMKVNYKTMNLLEDAFTLRSAIQQTFYGVITVCLAL